MFKKKTVDKYTYMTETPVPKLITELAVPTIISMLITGIYNTADTYFVGRVPGEATAATAAVGLVFPLMAVIQAFGFFFGHGSGNFLSRMLGAGKKKESSEMASNGFVMALLFGITIAILGNIFMGPLVEFLASDKVDASTLAMTDDYARIILIGAPFMMCQFVINSQLRFQGSAVYAMVGLVAGAIVNIILDPILILVLKMNVTGAAIATVLGQITSFVILLIGCSKGENIRLSLKNVNINKYYIVQIINGGIPSLFRQGLAAISGSLLNHAAAEFGGTPTVSGITIVSRTMMLCYFYATNIVEFYRKDPSVVSVGEVTLRFQTIVLPLNAFIVMTNMMLQSIGKGVKASITASARNGLFFIPAIIILPKLFGLTGVEITQMVADILTFMITIPFAISELKKMKSDIMVAGLHDSDI